MSKMRFQTNFKKKSLFRHLYFSSQERTAGTGSNLIRQGKTKQNKALCTFETHLCKKYDTNLWILIKKNYWMYF